MTTYKTLATDKQTGERVTIEREYNTKQEFIADVRRNGYKVNAKRTKETNLYNWIIENTNCNERDWEIRSIPK